MRNAYGKSTTQADFKQAQALFLLYSIEMTAEAARFKYIELKTIIKPPATDVKKKYLYIQVNAIARGATAAISVTLQLDDAMRNAYGKSTTQGDFKKTQALFLLYSIEMAAEAARFKYIEQKTVKQLPSDVEVASLVTKWDKLSVQIVESKAGVFEKPIDIQVAENPTKYWTVTNVEQIKPDIGILSYIKPKIADTSGIDEL